MNLVVGSAGPDTTGFGLGTQRAAWTNLNYYAKYFNVSTPDVRQRPPKPRCF